MPIDVKSRLMVALDFPDVESALGMARRLTGQVGWFKVGLELFNSAGPGILTELSELGTRVFYDCKLHDIPHTVAGAAAAVTRMGVAMFNLHTMGGTAMMRAAGESAQETAAKLGIERPMIMGVTILTSIDTETLRGELGVERPLTEQVVCLAQTAQGAGLDGVVASAQELAAIKEACGRGFSVVTPGIRPNWAESQDQKRTMTPRQALEAGADYLVLGRAITKSRDPEAALSRIMEEIES